MRTGSRNFIHKFQIFSTTWTAKTRSKAPLPQPKKGGRAYAATRILRNSKGNFRRPSSQASSPLGTSLHASEATTKERMLRRNISNYICPKATSKGFLTLSRVLFNRKTNYESNIVRNILIFENDYRFPFCWKNLISDSDLLLKRRENLKNIRVFLLSFTLIPSFTI